MSITYTPATNFGAKDSLPTNDPDKVIKGSEFTTEFTAIQTAFGLAAPAASPTFTGTVTIGSVDINGGAIDGTTIGAATPAAGSFTTVSATGNITVGGTVDGRDVAADGTKLDGIEAGADVTDTTNVTAAGALMDSELTDIAAVKALNQGVSTTDSPSFAGLTATGSVSLAGASTSADITFGDNDKAIFGAGSDLQIYSVSGNSFIQDTGTGSLFITGANSMYLQNGANETYIDATNNGAVRLFYDNANKLDTTSTGIDVTGTVTADGLKIENSTAVILTLEETGVNTFYEVVDGGNYALRNGSLTNTAFRVASNGDVSLYEDTGTTAKFFWDASAESLMLNATSRIASETLTVNGTVTTGGGTAAAPALAFRADSNTGIFRPAAQSIGFSANGSEAMRIDSSGNLLVDKTAIGLNTVGFEVRPNGIMASTRDGGSSAFFNRKTSDGSVVEFQKDGTTVGSIATGGGSLDVYSSGASNVGLRLSQAVIPMLNGAASPNTVDLGTNTREFKDLYLSGGVYLGGTGAANLLDDYEEGTWTPAFSFSTSGSVTYSDTTGAYTKVGRMVCVSCSLVVSSISSPTGNVSITGLPFTSATTGAVASAAIGGARNFVNSGLTLRVYNNPNSTSFVVATNDTDAGHAWLQGSNFTATTTLFITATYFV